ncbi:uncharacterized protein DUF1905 [Brevibacterium sanguinis]|uniref:Uncharacterized protein DUF1905 n=2 Tax=Brevibacterium TaxID=1696 RepID=A0A366II24_9MICO|nr:MULTISPECIES: YdeI/OmpD-associated family protein [Brevibacterium]RBP64232.1 uncharacterized protein DUF1905 [Brevibacterium sanguinis]RBP71476.1 uncharacterized protein DUF1905 [Brevibacterium celere]
MSTTTAPAQPIAFTATPETVGDRTIIRVPEDASAELPSRGQVAAHAVIDGHQHSIVVEPDGRRGHWLSVPADLREGLGDTVSVALTPTKDWPEPQLPDDLREALDAASHLAEVWAGLTPMARWEWVRWIGATRNPETRAKRVRVTISKLEDGKRRPCCFDLSSCTDPELSRSGKLIPTS